MMRSTHSQSKQVSVQQLSQLTLMVVCVLLLSACQTAFRKVPNETADKSVLTDAELQRILATQAAQKNVAKRRNVAFHCTGLHSCDIASIDRKPVISHRSGKPYRSAIRKNLLYIDNSNSQGGINYVGLLSSGSHLINIRFYPISEGAFENFAVRHTFKKDTVYRFHGYRKASTSLNANDVSLLALASPRPMCIVLYEGRQPIRQFCKEADIITGVGRFIEEPVTQPSTIKPSFTEGFQDNFFNRLSNG